jgi:flagellar biosynthesis component FlhA
MMTMIGLTNILIVTNEKELYKQQRNQHSMNYFLSNAVLNIAMFGGMPTIFFLLISCNIAWNYAAATNNITNSTAENSIIDPILLTTENADALSGNMSLTEQAQDLYTIMMDI